MKRRDGLLKQVYLTCSALLIFLLAGCAQGTRACPAQPYADLSGVEAFSNDARLPFGFPLENVRSDSSSSFTLFCASSSGPESARKYHAAEDYFRPAGTPVYALADGEVSFSGPMGGYGWLIIIDHPQANLYSLYGHLSPSRWRLDSGPVEKGALIAYLGDSHENGGSAEHPLEPHLHLGIRAGQRSDYPGMEAWRWQAGWIKPCPAGLGWLQPSVVITSQDIPVGGFPEPAASFVVIWWLELLFAGMYILGGVSMLVFATRKNKPFILFLSGAVLLAAGWIFYNKGTKMSYALFAMALLLAVVGMVQFLRRLTKMPRTPS
ncbi:MAG: M23 family metallopeptidase [Anaerolineales bacterium]|nr:M23 family metallopeptidase [Anaerolineales bacterium]